MRKLNQRATIDPDVADRLERFLSRRTQFVHGLQGLFNVKSASRRKGAVAYCQELG
jgi:plasmid maintenance system antidote protein VapI